VSQLYNSGRSGQPCLINIDDAFGEALESLLTAENGGGEAMSRKIAIWAVAAVSVLAMTEQKAYANEQEIVDRWTVELREAQKQCDAGRYRAAKRELLAGIDAQINTVDRYLRYISESSGEERARDQRLGVQLILDRQRLTSKRAMYAHERYVPCDDPDENLVAGADGEGRKVCDALGLSGLTISSDNNCLQIGGAVTYEFNWGGDAADTGSDLSGGASFWDFSVNFQPSLNFGGMHTRGAFATETPTPELVVPGYTFETSFQGAGVEAELSAKLPLGGIPIGVNVGLELNSASASSSATDVALPEGFGVPGVGPVSGAFINWPTDMLQFDYTAERQQTSAFFEAELPFAGGTFAALDHQAAFRLNGLVGVKGGFFSQHETIEATTSTPAFGLNAEATSIYDTDFSGSFSGFYAGLSLDKNIPFGDDGLSVQETFSFAAGYSMYRLNIEDRVLMTGLGDPDTILDDGNSYSVDGGIPTLELSASIGVGGTNWMAGIYTGLSLGKTAQIEHERLDDGGNPHTNILAEAGFTLGANFTGRF
jgi:hypothetical protein